MAKETAVIIFTLSLMKSQSGLRIERSCVMFSLNIKESYQRGNCTRIYPDYEISEICRDIKEVNDKVKSLNSDLVKMQILDVDKRPNRTVVRFFKPGKVGLLTRTISVSKYNPPVVEEFSFI